MQCRKQGERSHRRVCARGLMMDKNMHEVHGMGTLVYTSAIDVNQVPYGFRVLSQRINHRFAVRHCRKLWFRTQHIP